MSDLARQAAEDIVKLFLVKWDGDDVGDAASTIRLHGVLVSHEDAALLREMKRALACVNSLTIELMRNGEFCVEVISDRGLRRAIETGVDATAALKSALDAAGVPDEKGT